MTAPTGLKAMFLTRRDVLALSAEDWRAYTRLSCVNWLLVGVLVSIEAATVTASSLRLSVPLMPLFLVLAIGFGALALFYLFVRKDVFVAILANTVALMAASGLVVGAGCYVTQYWGASMPLRDDALAELDAAMGFDWPGWFAWLSGHPLMASILRFAYVSVSMQVLALAIAQFFLSWEVRFQRVLLASMIAVIITMAVAAAYPALGAFHYFEGRLDLHDLGFAPAVMNEHVPDLLNLRGPSPVLPLDDLKALITFPSFHAALGIVLIWAAWPNRVLRVGALALDGLMIVATPIFGTHYGVDVIAGVGVAAFAIWVVNAVNRSVAESHQSRAVQERASVGVMQGATRNLYETIETFGTP
jgi:hypothetical protein